MGEKIEVPNKKKFTILRYIYMENFNIFYYI